MRSRNAQAFVPILAAALACAACRAVIGVEDLVLDSDASVVGSSDASREGSTVGADAAASDATGADTSSPDTGKPAIDQCSGKVVPECFPCCRSTYTAAFDQLKQLAQNACYCGGHGCEAECGAWCTTPTGPPPSGPCGLCLDTKLRACPSVLSTCNGQGNCAPAAGCVQRCQ